MKGERVGIGSEGLGEARSLRPTFVGVPWMHNLITQSSTSRPAQHAHACKPACIDPGQLWAWQLPGSCWARGSRRWMIKWNQLLRPHNQPSLRDAITPSSNPCPEPHACDPPFRSAPLLAWQLPGSCCARLRPASRRPPSTMWVERPWAAWRGCWRTRLLGKAKSEHQHPPLKWPLLI